MATKFTPFPTFGGKDGIAGITPVKLAPTQMKFPTTRAPVRRAPEPTDKEKLAPLLPFVIGGITDALGLGQSKGSDEEYLQSLYDRAVLNPENLQDIKQNQKVQAEIDAYNLYGRPEEKNRFGLDEIINIGVASQMGRGAPAYAKSYLNLRSGEEKDRLTKMTARGDYVQKATNDDPYQLKTYFDLEAAKVGEQVLVDGILNPTDGRRYMYTPDGLVPLPANYIEFIPGQSGTNINDFIDKQLVSLKEITDEIKTTDQSTMQVLRVANDLIINNLDPAINGETIDPDAFIASLVNLGNNAAVEFEAIGTLLGGGNLNNFWSKSDTGGTKYAGKGTNAKLIWEDMSDFIEEGGDITAFGETQKEQEERVQAMLDKLAPAYNEVTGKNIRDLFQTTSANKAITTASYLQLAYMAAATSGQTGRTLSDKDLAFFLDIVGGGDSNDAKVQKTNLLRFIDSLINGQDINVQTRLSARDMRQYSPEENKSAASIIYPFYNPRVNEAGQEMWDDYDNYQLVKFKDRYKDIVSIRGVPILEEWYRHQSPLPSVYPRDTFVEGTSVSESGIEMISPPDQPDIDAQERTYLD
tara:strand:- start:158 stop:1903 length:1746 start_codon:yes stop_codon:yes gene_type:complete